MHDAGYDFQNAFDLEQEEMLLKAMKSNPAASCGGCGHGGGGVAGGSSYCGDALITRADVVNTLKELNSSVRREIFKEVNVELTPNDIIEVLNKLSQADIDDVRGYMVGDRNFVTMSLKKLSPEMRTEIYKEVGPYPDDVTEARRVVNVVQQMSAIEREQVIKSLPDHEFSIDKVKMIMKSKLPSDLKDILEEAKTLYLPYQEQIPFEPAALVSSFKEKPVSDVERPKRPDNIVESTKAHCEQIFVKSVIDNSDHLVGRIIDAYQNMSIAHDADNQLFTGLSYSDLKELNRNKVRCKIHESAACDASMAMCQGLCEVLDELTRQYTASLQDHKSSELDGLQAAMNDALREMVVLSDDMKNLVKSNKEKSSNKLIKAINNERKYSQQLDNEKDRSHKLEMYLKEKISECKNTVKMMVDQEKEHTRAKEEDLKRQYQNIRDDYNREIEKMRADEIDARGRHDWEMLRKEEQMKAEVERRKIDFDRRVEEITRDFEKDTSEFKTKLQEQKYQIKKLEDTLAHERMKADNRIETINSMKDKEIRDLQSSLESMRHDLEKTISDHKLEQVSTKHAVSSEKDREMEEILQKTHIQYHSELQNLDLLFQVVDRARSLSLGRPDKCSNFATIHSVRERGISLIAERNKFQADLNDAKKAIKDFEEKLDANRAHDKEVIENLRNENRRIVENMKNLEHHYADVQKDLCFSEQYNIALSGRMEKVNEEKDKAEKDVQQLKEENRKLKENFSSLQFDQQRRSITDSPKFSSNETIGSGQLVQLQQALHEKSEKLKEAKEELSKLEMQHKHSAELAHYHITDLEAQLHASITKVDYWQRTSEMLKHQKDGAEKNSEHNLEVLKIKSDNSCSLYQSQIDEARAYTQNLEQSLDKQSMKITQLEDALKSAENQLTRQADAMKHQDSYIETLISDLEKSRSAYLISKEQMLQINSELECLKHEAFRSNATVNEQSVQIQSHLSKLDAIPNMNMELEVLHLENSQLKQSNIHLGEECEGLKRANMKLIKQGDLYRQQILQNENEKLLEEQNLFQLESKFNREMEISEKTIKEKCKEIDQLNAVSAEKELKIQQKLSDYKHELKRVEGVASWYNNENVKLEGEINTLKANYQDAVHQAKEKDIMLLNSKEYATELNQKLQKLNMACQETQRNFDGELNRLKNNLSMVPTMEFELRSLENTIENISRDKAAFKKDLSIVNSMREKETIEMLKLESYCKEMKHSNNVLSQRNDNLCIELSQKLELTKNQNKEIESLQNMLLRNEFDQNMMEKDSQHLRKRLYLTNESRKSKDASFNELHKEFENVSNEKQYLKELSETMQSKLSKQLEDCEHEKRMRDDIIKELNAQLMELERILAERECEFQRLLNELNSVKCSMGDRISILSDEKQFLEKELNGRKIIIQKLKQQIESVKQDNAVLESNLLESNDRSKWYYQELGHANEVNCQLNSEKAHLNKKADELQAANMSLCQDLKQLSAKIGKYKSVSGADKVPNLDQSHDKDNYDELKKANLLMNDIINEKECYIQELTAKMLILTEEHKSTLHELYHKIELLNSLGNEADELKYKLKQSSKRYHTEKNNYIKQFEDNKALEYEKRVKDSELNCVNFENDSVKYNLHNANSNLHRMSQANGMLINRLDKIIVEYQLNADYYHGISSRMNSTVRTLINMVYRLKQTTSSIKNANEICRSTQHNTRKVFSKADEYKHILVNHTESCKGKSEKLRKLKNQVKFLTEDLKNLMLVDEQHKILLGRYDATMRELDFTSNENIKLHEASSYRCVVINYLDDLVKDYQAKNSELSNRVRLLEGNISDLKKKFKSVMAEKDKTKFYIHELELTNKEFHNSLLAKENELLSTEEAMYNMQLSNCKAEEKIIKLSNSTKQYQANVNELGKMIDDNFSYVQKLENELSVTGSERVKSNNDKAIYAIQIEELTRENAILTSCNNQLNNELTSKNEMINACEDNIHDLEHLCDHYAQNLRQNRAEIQELQECINTSNSSFELKINELEEAANVNHVQFQRAHSKNHKLIALLNSTVLELNGKFHSTIEQKRDTDRICRELQRFIRKYNTKLCNQQQIISNISNSAHVGRHLLFMENTNMRNDIVTMQVQNKNKGIDLKIQREKYNQLKHEYQILEFQHSEICLQNETLVCQLTNVLARNDVLEEVALRQTATLQHLQIANTQNKNLKAEINAMTKLNSYLTQDVTSLSENLKISQSNLEIIEESYRCMCVESISKDNDLNELKNIVNNIQEQFQVAQDTVKSKNDIIEHLFTIIADQERLIKGADDYCTLLEDELFCLRGFHAKLFKDSEYLSKLLHDVCYEHQLALEAVKVLNIYNEQLENELFAKKGSTPREVFIERPVDNRQLKELEMLKKKLHDAELNASKVELELSSESFVGRDKIKLFNGIINFLLKELSCQSETIHKMEGMFENSGELMSEVTDFFSGINSNLKILLSCNVFQKFCELGICLNTEIDELITVSNKLVFLVHKLNNEASEQQMREEELLNEVNLILNSKLQQNAKCAELYAIIEKNYAKLSLLTSYLVELLEELNALRAQQKLLEEVNEEKNMFLTNCVDDIKCLSAYNCTLQNEVLQEKINVECREIQISNLQIENEKLRQKIIEAKAIEQERNQLFLANKKLTEDLEHTNIALSESHEQFLNKCKELEDEQNVCNQLRLRLEEQLGQISRLKEAELRALDQMAEMQRNHERKEHMYEERLEKMREAKHDLEVELEEKNAKICNLETIINKLDYDLLNLKKAFDELSGEYDKLEREKHQLLHSLMDAKKVADDLIKQNLEKEDYIQRLKNNALNWECERNGLLNIIKELEKDSLGKSNLIDHLKADSLQLREMIAVAKNHANLFKELLVSECNAELKDLADHRNYKDKISKLLCTQGVVMHQYKESIKECHKAVEHISKKSNDIVSHNFRLNDKLTELTQCNHQYNHDMRLLRDDLMKIKHALDESQQLNQVLIIKSNKLLKSGEELQQEKTDLLALNQQNQKEIMQQSKALGEIFQENEELFCNIIHLKQGMNEKLRMLENCKVCFQKFEHTHEHLNENYQKEKMNGVYLSSQIDTLKVELASKSENEALLQCSLSQAQERTKIYEHKLMDLEHILKDSNQQNIKLENKNEQLTLEVTTTKLKLQDFEAECGLLSAQVSKYEQDLSATQQKLNEAFIYNECKTSELDHLHYEVDSLMNRLKSSEETAEKLKTENFHFNYALVTADQELYELNLELDHYDKINLTYKDHIGNLQNDISTLNADIADIEHIYLKLMSRHEDSLLENDRLNAKVLEMGEVLGQQKSSMYELQFLHKKLLEEMAEKDAAHATSLQKKDVEIHNLKLDINDVNHYMVEYKEIIQSQLEHIHALEVAAKDLDKIIQDKDLKLVETRQMVEKLVGEMTVLEETLAVSAHQNTSLFKMNLEREWHQNRLDNALTSSYHDMAHQSANNKRLQNQVIKTSDMDVKYKNVIFEIMEVAHEVLYVLMFEYMLSCQQNQALHHIINEYQEISAGFLLREQTIVGLNDEMYLLTCDMQNLEGSNMQLGSENERLIYQLAASEDENEALIKRAVQTAEDKMNLSNAVDSYKSCHDNNLRDVELLKAYYGELSKENQLNLDSFKKLMQTITTLKLENQETLLGWDTTKNALQEAEMQMAATMQCRDQNMALVTLRDAEILTLKGAVDDANLKIEHLEDKNRWKKRKIDHLREVINFVIASNDEARAVKATIMYELDVHASIFFGMAEKLQFFEVMLHKSSSDIQTEINSLKKVCSEQGNVIENLHNISVFRFDQIVNQNYTISNLVGCLENLDCKKIELEKQIMSLDSALLSQKTENSDLLLKLEDLFSDYLSAQDEIKYYKKYTVAKEAEIQELVTNNAKHLETIDDLNSKIEELLTAIETWKRMEEIWVEKYENAKNLYLTHTNALQKSNNAFEFQSFALKNSNDGLNESIVILKSEMGVLETTIFKQQERILCLIYQKDYLANEAKRYSTWYDKQLIIYKKHNIPCKDGRPKGKRLKAWAYAVIAIQRLIRRGLPNTYH